MTTQLLERPIKPLLYMNPDDAHQRFKELMNRMPFHHAFETFFNVEFLDEVWQHTNLAEFPGVGNVKDPYRYLLAVKHAVRDGASTILYWSVIETQAFRTGYTYRFVMLAPNDLPLANTAEQAIMAVAQVPFGSWPRPMSEFQFTEHNPPYRWRFRFEGTKYAAAFSHLMLASRFGTLVEAIEKRCTPA